MHYTKNNIFCTISIRFTMTLFSIQGSPFESLLDVFYKAVTLLSFN